MYTNEEIARMRAKRKADQEALKAKRDAQALYRYVGMACHPSGITLTRTGNTIGSVVSQLSNSMELYYVSMNNLLAEGESFEIKITREK